MTENINTKGETRKAFGHLVHYIIMIALILLIGHASPIEPLTVKGMQMIGILAGCIWGWSFIGLIGLV